MSTQWRTAFLVAVGLCVLWIGYLASAVVTPLLAALLLAYILDPLVKALERRGLSRPVASGGVVVVALLGILLIATVAVTRAFAEGEAFYMDVVGEPIVAKLSDEPPRPADDAGDRVPTLLPTKWEGVEVWYEDLDGDRAFQPGYARLGTQRLRELSAEYNLDRYLDDALDTVADVGPQFAKGAGDVVRQVARGGRRVAAAGINLITLLILFPIYLYYSLVGLARVYDVTVEHLPAEHRDQVVGILQQIHATLSAFFRGRLLTMAGKGVLLFVLFVILDVPFALVCATIAAIASLVPVLGGIVAAGLPLALGLSAGFGIAQLAGLAIGLVAVEIIEGYVLIPALIGTRVGLHPLTVLVSAFVAGDLMGVFGMLIALPLTAVLKILSIEFVLPEIRRRAGRTDAADPPPDPPPEGGPDEDPVAGAKAGDPS